jgi:hypothetical protein
MGNSPRDAPDEFVVPSRAAFFHESFSVTLKTGGKSCGFQQFLNY